MNHQAGENIDQPKGRFKFLSSSTTWSVLSAVFFLVALWLLHYEFKSVKLEDVAASFKSLPALAIAGSFLFTILNFVAMIGHDWLGVRLVKHRLTLKQIAIVSTLYYAFSNSLGMIFGGTPVRVRLYSGWGMSSSEIVRLIALIGGAFWIGLFLLGGCLFAAWPFEIPSRFNLPIASSRPLGWLMLGITGLFFAACIFRKKPVMLMGVNFQPPPISIGLAQAVVSALDFLFASAALYVLLPDDLSIGFLPFTGIFLLAIILALVSNVPAGLGVLELVMVTMLPGSSTGLIASLLAFRIIYYLMPLLLAFCGIGIVSGANLFFQQRCDVGRPGKIVRSMVSSAANIIRVVAPRMITGVIFVAGLILLISGSLPAADGRLTAAQQVIPLPLVEVSHFVGSIIGALLLVIARALQRRIDAAWTLTVGLLGFGIIVLLLKGFNYSEAAALAIMLVSILPCRSFFYRKANLLPPTMGVVWILSVLMSIGLLLWIFLFAYQNVEYSRELWWSFTYQGDAPRSLRAMLGVSIVLVLATLANLLRSRPVIPELPTPEELADVARIVAAYGGTSANLALLGDKRFVFSDDRQAFIMFGCNGKSWIAMGDAVGPAGSVEDVAWKFREACDFAGVRAVFYQVNERSLSRYVDMGMTLLKLGEEARVPIVGFSLNGSARKDLRYAKKKAVEAGLKFEVISRECVREIMPQLRAISDHWLTDKSAVEKGFSLGYFDDDYLSSFDIAVVFQADQPIAFANIWRSADKQVLAIDLMRYVSTAPYGVMEYLFVELLLYGSAEGYQWFSLGMAPLSGVESHRLGPLWNRVSSMMYQHGKHFYNFKGLRAYKAKFDPVWFPRYLAVPGGLATPGILADVSTMIAGGFDRILNQKIQRFPQGVKAIKRFRLDSSSRSKKDPSLHEVLGSTNVVIDSLRSIKSS